MRDLRAGPFGRWDIRLPAARPGAVRAASFHLEERGMKRYAVVTAVLLAVTACQDSTSPRPMAAPPSGVNAAQRSAKGDYIVVLKSDETNPDASADALVKGHGGQLKHVYRKALKGFAVRNLSDAAVDALR